MTKEKPYSILNLDREEIPPIGEGVDWTEMARTQFANTAKDSDEEDLDFSNLPALNATQSVAINLFISWAINRVVTPDNYQDTMEELVVTTSMSDDDIHRHFADAIRNKLHDDEVNEIDPAVYEKMTKALRVLA